jgi:hypothetical protein
MRSGQRCRLRPHPFPSGGERRYLRPQIPFSRTRTPLRLLCRVLGSLLLGLLLDNPEIAFANRRSLSLRRCGHPRRPLATRLPSFRPCHQLTAAVRADAIHAGGAAGTEGTFAAADPGLAAGQELGSTLLARGPHFKRHGRATRALRSPESAAGPLVCLFAGRIDARGVVLVAFSAALRHPRRPLWISEPLRRADVARALLILDLGQDYLRRLTDLRSLSSFLNGAQLRHSAAILAFRRS